MAPTQSGKQVLGLLPPPLEQRVFPAASKAYRLPPPEFSSDPT